MTKEIDNKIDEYICKFGSTPKKLFLDHENHLKLQQSLASINPKLLEEYKGNILGISLSEYKGIPIERVERGVFIS